MLLRVQRLEQGALLMRMEVQRLLPEVQEQLAAARARLVREYVHEGLEGREAPPQQAHLLGAALPVLQLHIQHALCKQSIALSIFCIRLETAISQNT